jgi:pimeloyl-ACP methyl ester carboxylesterase
MISPMPWSYPVLALLIIGIGLLLLGAVIVSATFLAIRPPRMTRAKAIARLRRLSPGDLGLEFQNVGFQVRDDFTGRDISIAGWWIDADRPTGRCVLILHGFSDAKVGGIAWAPMWRALGFNILAVDLRAHGESGGRYSTAGWYERQDVSQVIDQVRRQRPQQTRRMVLFGVSLGAAVAAATACLRTDIDAVVMDCPYADFGSAAATHAKMWGMPSGWMTRVVLWLGQKIARADFKAVRPADLIGQVPCPVMLIRSSRDFLVDPGDDVELTDAVDRRPSVTGPILYWRIDEAGHILGLAADPEVYQRRIGDFINEALNSASSADPGPGAPAAAPAGASRPAP